MIMSTSREREGETVHHTVLLGEEGTVKDAIGLLTTDAINELSKEFKEKGRVNQNKYVMRKRLLESLGAETKVLENDLLS